MRKLLILALCLPCYAQTPAPVPPGLAKLQQAVTDLTAAVQRLSQPVPSPGAGILPGQTALFAAFPAGQFGLPTTMPASFTPVWTTSDPINCPLANPYQDANSSQVNVTVPAAFVPAAGQFCILTVASPDGTGASSIVVPFTAPVQGPFSTAILNYQVPPQVITRWYVYQIAVPASTTPGAAVAKVERPTRAAQRP
jgi:hypothetical protein